MSKKNRQEQRQNKPRQQPVEANKLVDSLLGSMIDGREYTSILDKMLKPPLNPADEIIKGIAAIESLRNRPCLIYAGNVLTGGSYAGVDPTDDVPFQELVASVPADKKQVDIYLATNGGSGEQISRFVNCLRSRFDEVNFLIPSFCMSAGTLFALSGERIYMTRHACLGPIDPQVPSADGRFVPAQALLLLVAQLQAQGDEALRSGAGVPWTAVRLIDSLDKKELGAAITASDWSKTLAERYIEEYKFKTWTIRESSKKPVTPEYKKSRAREIANALGSHQRWKSHGHAISRDVLWNEIKLKIDTPDDALERAMVRLWALLTWTFDKAQLHKIICSNDYRFFRASTQQIMRAQP